MSSMKTKNVKAKINKLLNSVEGPKMTKYKVIAAMLHISERHVISLSKGEKRAAYHLAEFISKVLDNG